MSQTEKLNTLDQQLVINLDPRGENRTLYAVWEANGYIIKFDGSGANSGIMVDQNAIYDVSTKLTANTYPVLANTFAKTGYVFNDWKATVNGLEVKFIDEATVLNLITEGEITLYAEWLANDYSVIFNENTGTGTMTNQEFKYDESKALSTNTFTKEGYRFSGWSLTPDGTVDYTDSQEVSNLVTEQNGTITLYAVWTANDYSVIFNENTGTGTMANQEFKYDASKALSTNAFTKTGYTFTGWSLMPIRTASGTVDYTDGEEVSKLVTEQNGTITLYAVWITFGDITAHDHIMESKDAISLGSLDALISLMGASGNFGGTPIIPIVSSEFETEILSGKKGIYDVTFTNPKDPNVSITVKLTIVPNGSTIDPINKASVYAEDKTIYQSEAKAITNINELTNLMNGYATFDNTVVTANPSTIRFNEIQMGNIDTYEITFTNSSVDSVQYIALLTVIKDIEEPVVPPVVTPPTVSPETELPVTGLTLGTVLRIYFRSYRINNF